MDQMIMTKTNFIMTPFIIIQITVMIIQMNMI
jgi:hypothetical protein